MGACIELEQEEEPEEMKIDAGCPEQRRNPCPQAPCPCLQNYVYMYGIPYTYMYAYVHMCICIHRDRLYGAYSLAVKVLPKHENLREARFRGLRN